MGDRSEVMIILFTIPTLYNKGISKAITIVFCLFFLYSDFSVHPAVAQTTVLAWWTSC